MTIFSSHQGDYQWIPKQSKDKKHLMRKKMTAALPENASQHHSPEMLWGRPKKWPLTFQSSSPSSIIAKAANGFTLRTSPILARLSPISTTSTTEKGHTKKVVRLNITTVLVKNNKRKIHYQDHYPQMLLQHQNLQ
jgi:hypothetical protein